MIKKIYCLEGNGARESHHGDGYKEGETMYTLNTVEIHSIAYAWGGGEDDKSDIDRKAVL